MKNILFKILKSFIIVYFIVGLFLYLFQDLFLFHNARYVPHNYKTINIKSKDNIDIKIIVLNPGKKTGVIYLMGNAGSYVYAAERLTQIDRNKKYTYYIMNYRGFSAEKGIPSQKAIENDVLRLYDTIKNRHENIIVVGRSIGSYFATYLATKRKVDKLILLTPFDSVLNLAKDKFKIYPITLMLKEDFNTLDIIDKVDSNISIILADNDTVVPYKNSKNLIDHINQKSVVQVENTTHLNLLWKRKGKVALSKALNTFFY